jgi:hypothetical protein
MTMIEYGHVDVPELLNLQAALERDYRFTICTMNFPGYCEDVIARMVEFGKRLGDPNFNYMRVADTDHAMHYFYFNREEDFQAFQAKFAANLGPDFNNAVADHSYMT